MTKAEYETGFYNAVNECDRLKAKVEMAIEALEYLKARLPPGKPLSLGVINDALRGLKDE